MIPMAEAARNKNGEGDVHQQPSDTTRCDRRTVGEEEEEKE